MTTTAAESWVAMPAAYTGSGFRVADAAATPWVTIAQGLFDPYVFEMLDVLLAGTGGAFFVDIGAYVGPLTLYAASLNASVYAVEADVQNFDMLRANVLANPEALRRRISTHLLAVSNQSGVGRMSKPASSSGESAVSMLDTVMDSRPSEAHAAELVEWTVPTVDLRTYLLELRRLEGDAPMVLSMDIEGAEAEALQSGFPLLAALPPAQRPPLVLELHPGFFAVASGARARYVSATCRALSLYRHLFFLGRADSPTCDSHASQPDLERSRQPCHFAARLIEFLSVHDLALFMSNAAQDAFMLFAASEMTPAIQARHGGRIRGGGAESVPGEDLGPAYQASLARKRIDARSLFGLSSLEAPDARRNTFD